MISNDAWCGEYQKREQHVFKPNKKYVLPVINDTVFRKGDNSVANCVETPWFCYAIVCKADFWRFA